MLKFNYIRYLDSLNSLVSFGTPCVQVLLAVDDFESKWNDIVISLGRKVVRFNDCYTKELDRTIIRALQPEFVLENGEIYRVLEV